MFIYSQKSTVEVLSESGCGGGEYIWTWLDFGLKESYPRGFHKL